MEAIFGWIGQAHLIFFVLFTCGKFYVIFCIYSNFPSERTRGRNIVIKELEEAQEAREAERSHVICISRGRVE